VIETENQPHLAFPVMPIRPVTGAGAVRALLGAG
jgi:hypothetical protein